jgi:hypothetical protein
MMVVATAAQAEGSANQSALPGGKPAGVKEAISFNDHKLLWIVGGGVVIGGIVLVATGNGHGAVNPTCSLPGCIVTPPTTTATTTATATTTH